MGSNGHVPGPFESYEPRSGTVTFEWLSLPANYETVFNFFCSRSIVFSYFLYLADINSLPNLPGWKGGYIPEVLVPTQRHYRIGKQGNNGHPTYHMVYHSIPCLKGNTCNLLPQRFLLNNAIGNGRSAPLFEMAAPYFFSITPQ